MWDRYGIIGAPWCCKINLQLYLFYIFKVIILYLVTEPQKTNVFPHYFKPSVVNLIPLINNFQVPYLKNDSYSFIFHTSHIAHQETDSLPARSLCSSLKCALTQMDFGLLSSILQDEPMHTAKFNSFLQASLFCNVLVPAIFLDLTKMLSSTLSAP